MKEYKRVDKKAKIAWTITRLVFMLVVAGGVALGLFSAAENESEFMQNIWITAAVAVPLLLFAIIYPQVEYVQWAYSISDDRIEIKKGIIWRKYTVLPVARIQHVESACGVLQRMLGLSTVKIFTAGGMHKIENLSAKTAEEICSLLEQQVTKKIRAKEAAEVKADA